MLAYSLAKHRLLATISRWCCALDLLAVEASLNKCTCRAKIWRSKRLRVQTSKYRKSPSKTCLSFTHLKTQQYEKTKKVRGHSWRQDWFLQGHVDSKNIIRACSYGEKLPGLQESISTCQIFLFMRNVIPLAVNTRSCLNTPSQRVLRFSLSFTGYLL